jgi:hypothetical protein
VRRAIEVHWPTQGEAGPFPIDGSAPTAAIRRIRPPVQPKARHSSPRDDLPSGAFAVGLSIQFAEK